MLKNRTLRLITIVALCYNLIGCAHARPANKPSYPTTPQIKREYKLDENKPKIKECKLEYNPEEYRLLDYLNKEPEEEKYPEWMVKTKEVIDDWRTHRFGDLELKGRYKEVEIKDDRFPGWRLTGGTDSVEIKKTYKFDYLRFNEFFSYMNPLNLFKNNK